MNTLRQILESHNKYITEDSLEETLRECFPIVWEGDDEEYRWRIEYSIVCKIVDGGVDRYFKYTSCKGTNDNSWEDAGYTFEGIDSVVEVYPREVTTVVYSEV